MEAVVTGFFYGRVETAVVRNRSRQSGRLDEVKFNAITIDMILPHFSNISRRDGSAMYAAVSYSQFDHPTRKYFCEFHPTLS